MQLLSTFLCLLPFQEDGFCVLKFGFKVSPIKTKELLALNSYFPMSSAMFDESFIRLLVADVNIKRSNLCALMKGRLY